MADLNVALKFNAPQLAAWQACQQIRTSITLPWGRGVGKALALDTPLPTPTGWTTMGAVLPGDALLDENGLPCRVIDVTPVQHGRDCYSVVFDDGSEIVADAEHWWLTWDHRARKSHGDPKYTRLPPLVRTTKEIADSLTVAHGREHNHSVSVASPLQLPDADLPIPPYTLGVWLGDGTSSDPSVTAGSEDIHELRSLLCADGTSLGPIRKTNTAHGFAIGYVGGRGRRNPVLAALRNFGLINNKHVPPVYLRASEVQRRALLAGLLDTDGHCDHRGIVEFTTTRRALFDGVFELLCSLGFKPGSSVGKATLNGRIVSDKYRVTFTPRRSVFGLRRKNAPIRTNRQQANRTSHRYIVDARRVPSVPVKCISVDSPNRLFLAGKTMVPTHNSHFLRAFWYLLVAQHDRRLRTRKDWAGQLICPAQDAVDPFRGVRIITLMPTLKQFKGVHAEGILDELTGDGKWAWLGAKIDRTTWNITFPGGSIIRPFPAREHSAVTARGMRCDVITADECDDIDPSVYDAVATPWLSEPWSLGLELCGGTPRRGRHGLLYRRHRAGLIGDKLRAGLNVENLTDEQREKYVRSYSFHATYLTAPDFIDPSAVRDAKADSAPAVFRREWLCDFDSAEGLVYGDVFDERFHVRNPPENVTWNEILIGADHGWEDPGVLLFIGVLGHGRDAICWVLDEIYEPHRPPSWWKQKAAEWFTAYPQHTFYGDPSRADLMAEFRSVGARVRPVDNSIDEGVEAVADRLVVRRDDEGNNPQARLYIAPRCENLIREFGTYRRKRDPKDPDRYLDVIEDRNNHAHDPLRYCIYSRFGGPRSGRNVASYDARA